MKFKVMWIEADIEEQFPVGWRKVKSVDEDGIERSVKYTSPEDTAFKSKAKALEHLNKGRTKKKRKVGDNSVDPTPIQQTHLSQTKKCITSTEDSETLLCHICKVAFNDVSQKEMHMTKIHKSKKSNGEKKVVPKMKEVQNMSKEFHPCLATDCLDRFASKTQLKKHTRSVHKKNNSAKTKRNLKASNAAPPPRPLRPPPGPPSSSRTPPGPPGPLAAEEKEEEGKEFYCEECGSEFDKRQQLVQHMRSEHEEDTVIQAQGSQAAETDPEEDLELDEFIPTTVHGHGNTIMEGFEVCEAESDQEEIRELSNGFAKLASQTDQYPRYPPLRQNINYDDFSDEEMETEDSEDNDEYSSDDEIMIESPRKAAEEITLDEDSDEEVVVEKVRNDQYDKELKRIQDYERFLSNEKAFDILTNEENEDPLRIIQENAWFAKPRNWKPTSPWETWHATVKQICTHYKLIDFRLNDNQRFSSYDDFSSYVTEPMKEG